MNKKKWITICTIVGVVLIVGTVIFTVKGGFFSDASARTEEAKVLGEVQKLETTLESRDYPTLVVQKGVPVKWTIIATEETLNSCNNEIVIPEYNISKKLVLGENVIEFTPTEEKTIGYSCWMGMINATITVVEDIDNYSEEAVESSSSQVGAGTGCCTRR